MVANGTNGMAAKRSGDSLTLEPDEMGHSRFGNDLLIKLHVLMKVSQIYDQKNVVLNQVVKGTLELINYFLNSEGSLNVKVIRDGLFINGKRLKVGVESYIAFKFVLEQLQKKRLGEIRIFGGLGEQMLKEFVYHMMNLDDGDEKNAVKLRDDLKQLEIKSIAVEPLEIIEEDEFFGGHSNPKEAGKRIFFETIGVIKEVVTGIKKDHFINARKMKRMVQGAINLMVKDESILLGLTTIKNYDEYTFNHCVNVSIYSLAMGRRLGFSKKILAELGITALLHDIGKAKIPKEIINKPDRLDGDEWRLMKEHPMIGVEMMLKIKQLGEMSPKMVIGVFEHHLNSDLTGYPKLIRKKDLTLFGKIIKIADCYDAMTTPRIYRSKPYRPEQALAIMVRDKNCFDPILLKVFIGIIGIYPIGSLVLLDTKEMGVVYETNPDPNYINRPKVILISQSEGKRRIGPAVNLAEMDGETNNYKRCVLKALDPRKYHVNIVKHFL
ncbi:MAG: HD domain-containing protein [Syntrophobacterales bacterium]|nr:MAG: HD domain-containing protein [Syntrophobacterales bacterium]